MKKNSILTLVLCVFLVLTGFACMKGYIWWRRSVHISDYQNVKHLLATGDPTKALPIILKYQDLFYWKTPLGMDWLPLLTEALMQTHNEVSLAQYYLSYPRLIDNDERRAFAVAEGLIASRRVDVYEKLRKEWKAKPHNEAAWFPLDADALIVQGKKAESVALLESRYFDSPDDSLRLIRLAVYKAGDNLPMAWNYFSRALIVDPKNSQIYLYRGKILEQWHRPDLARQEYLNAIEKNPNEAFLYDQLAEFYRRQLLMKEALETWAKTLSLPKSDPYRLKLIFWNLVTVPLSIDWSQQPVPGEDLKPLVDFLLALPPKKLWDEQAFERLPNYQNYLKNYQETFWLRFVDALLDKRKAHALDLVTNTIFINDLWAPDLAQRLLRLLDDRQDDPLRPMGPYAFAVAFLAAGWFRTALDFGIPKSFPDGVPSWIPDAYVQAIRQTQNPLAALDFALAQKPTKSMTALIVQLILENIQVNSY